MPPWRSRSSPTCLFFITFHSEAPLEKFERFVAYLADDPQWDQFAGIYLSDEPTPSKDGGQQWNHLRERTELIRQRWPHLITLIGNATSPPSGLRPYLRWIHDIMAEQIQPDIYIHQFYPFHWSTDGRARFEWYHIMDYYSQFAKKTGSGFWSYPLTGCKRMPMSESALRLEKFGALAYGVQGFMDFGYDLYRYDEPIFTKPHVNDIQYVNIVKQPDGTLKEVPTATFETHAHINREVANVAKSLIRLEHLRTYHVDVVPGLQQVGHYLLDGSIETGRPQWDWFEGSVHRFHEQDTLRSGKLTDVRGMRINLNEHGQPHNVTLINNLMIGFFRDRQDEEYFLVVNKRAMTRTERLIGEPPLTGRLPGEDWPADHPQAMQQVTLSFRDDVSAIERLSRVSGKVESIDLTDHRYTFDLPGGTGDLFKYETNSAFVGAKSVSPP